MMKRFTITFVLLLLLISNSLLAQDTTVDQESSLAIPTEVVTQDTLIKDVNHSSELNKISDIRSQFEKQNSTYSAPVKPGESLLRFVKKIMQPFRKKHCTGHDLFGMPHCALTTK